MYSFFQKRGIDLDNYKSKESLGKSGSKTVPNPNGKKGGVAHQSVIDDIRTDAEKQYVIYVRQ